MRPVFLISTICHLAGCLLLSDPTAACAAADAMPAIGSGRTLSIAGEQIIEFVLPAGEVGQVLYLRRTGSQVGARLLVEDDIVLELGTFGGIEGEIWALLPAHDGKARSLELFSVDKTSRKGEFWFELRAATEFDANKLGLSGFPKRFSVEEPSS